MSNCNFRFGSAKIGDQIGRIVEIVQKIPRHVARVDRLDHHVESRLTRRVAQIGDELAIAGAGVRDRRGRQGRSSHARGPHPVAAGIAQGGGDRGTKIRLPVWQALPDPAHPPAQSPGGKLNSACVRPFSCSVAAICASDRSHRGTGYSTASNPACGGRGKAVQEGEFVETSSSGWRQSAAWSAFHPRAGPAPQDPRSSAQPRRHHRAPCRPRRSSRTSASAIEATGVGNFSPRPISVTMPRSLVKMSTALRGA